MARDADAADRAAAKYWQEVASVARVETTAAASPGRNLAHAVRREERDASNRETKAPVRRLRPRT